MGGDSLDWKVDLDETPRVPRDFGLQSLGRIMRDAYGSPLNRSRPGSRLFDVAGNRRGKGQLYSTLMSRCLPRFRSDKTNRFTVKQELRDV